MPNGRCGRGAALNVLIVKLSAAADADIRRTIDAWRYGGRAATAALQRRKRPRRRKRRGEEEEGQSEAHIGGTASRTPPNLGRPLSPLIIRLPSRDVFHLPRRCVCVCVRVYERARSASVSATRRVHLHRCTVMHRCARRVIWEGSRPRRDDACMTKPRCLCVVRIFYETRRKFHDGTNVDALSAVVVIGDRR